MSTPGPSRPRYQSTLPEYRPPRAFSSRPTTPSPHIYNSHGFITTPAFANDSALRSQWHDSVNRLQKVWDDLITRYEKVDAEDQGDDIDITTGRVILDRGHLRGLERRDFYLQGEGDGFGVGSENGEEVEEEKEFESDEDEMSVWDDRSRLETQGLESEDEVREVWTQEDEDDMQAFLQAEERRKSLMGDEEEDGTEGVKPVAGHIPRRNKVIKRNSPTLEDLFTDEGEGEGEWESDSEDELLAQTSEAEDASRVVLISSPPTSSPTSAKGPRTKAVSAVRAKSILEVVIPMRSKSLAPITRQPPPVTLDDLFSPPPQPILSPPSIDPVVPSSPMDKGKQRMRGERPSEDPPLPTITSHTPLPVVPNAYHTTIWHTRNGVTARKCKACVAAGGELAQKAAYCRGRVGVGRCPFEFGITLDAETADASSVSKAYASSPAVSTSRQADPTTRTFSRALTAPAGQGNTVGMTHNGNTTSDDEDNIPLSLPPSRTRRQRRSSTRIPHESTASDPALGSSKQPDIEDNETPPRKLITPTNLDRTKYYGELNWPSNSSVPRVCHSCDDAGGKRKDMAPWCKGRWRARECSFDSLNVAQTKQKRSVKVRARTVELDHDDLESLTSDNDGVDIFAKRSKPIEKTLTIQKDDLESDTETSPTIHVNPAFVERRRRESTVGTPAPPGLDTKRYSQKSYMIVGGKNERSCKFCVAAGGIRKERARWCKGSVWAKKCSFLARDGEGEGEGEFVVGGESEKVSRSSEETRPPITPVGDHLVLDEVIQVVRGREATRSESAGPIKMKRKRGKVILSTYGPNRASSVDNDVLVQHTIAKSVTPAPTTLRKERTFSRSSATNGQNLLPSPAPSGSGSLTNRKSSITAPRVLRASSSISSLPPSSPPAHLSSYFDTRAFTPSPSLSNLRSDLASGLTDSSPAVSSPIRRIAVLRGHHPVHPTPPTSITSSYRDSSVASSTAYFDSARKGILRRPSDFSSSSQPPSAKRIRFSMVPRSPTRSTSPDQPAQAGGDPDSDDELLLRPVANTPSSSPVPSSDKYDNFASTSSPFPSAMHVRAADVGLSLGPAHTGRLPRTLLNALAPSMVGGYTLPPPPPVPIERNTTPTQKGLMLPPPIPVSQKQRQTPLRQSHSEVTLSGKGKTTSEDDSPSLRSQTSIPAKTIEAKRFTTPSQPRVRSRSFSTQPAIQRISLASFPSSTPRRNAKFERELARVAREVGDEAGLEWGMDEDVGLEIGRMWREGSVVRYVT